MTAAFFEQIALVETHIELEKQARANCEMMLAVCPTVRPEYEAELERLAHELTVWTDILETLRRLNTH